MIIDGTKIASNIYKDLQNKVGKLAEKNIVPHLAVILVGENPASVAYVTLKQKKGEAIGAKITLLRYDTSVATAELLKKLVELNNDPTVHGILIQRPLPPQIDVEKLELATSPEKDIDGFHPDSPYTLPLPLAVVKILEEIYKIKTLDTPDTFRTWLASQVIVVLGKGPTGGGPIIKLLNKLGVNPTIIDSKTANPKDLMLSADIIVASTGRENMVTPDAIKKGAILVGVGILRGTAGKLKGDYDEEKIKDVAGFYTPTPGGVGPVNVAMLMVNLLTATETQTNMLK